MKKVLIVGDVHNEFPRLNDLINKNKDRLELVICCGDFGYWPSAPASWNVVPLDHIKNKGIPILWCDGNHEDHWALARRESDELAPDVFYMPRGSTYDLPDGRRILFMGGAHSIDKQWREFGTDWFPEEVIDHGDIDNLPPDDTRIDILISHTCSMELLPIMLEHDSRKVSDPSNYALSIIVSIFKPSFWYFGHWHYKKKGITENGCNWTALSMTRRTGWWEWLPERK